MIYKKRAINKILYISANPIEYDNTRPNNELEEIKNALNRAQKKIKLISLPNATNRAINNTIIEEKPTIIHFCGHGTETALYTHNIQNERIKDKLRDDLLLIIIRENPCIKHVILNCCSSHKIAETIFRNVSSINSVIGTTNLIVNNIGIEFAKSFYLSLGISNNTKEAYHNGKNAVLISNSNESDSYVGYFRKPHKEIRKTNWFKNFIKSNLKVISLWFMILITTTILLFFKDNLHEFYCQFNHSDCLADTSIKIINNQDNFVYKHGDSINIQVKSNSEIYIRSFLYIQQHQKLYLLSENQKIKPNNSFFIVNEKADIKNGKKLSLFIFYSKTSFPNITKDLSNNHGKHFVSNSKLKKKIISQDIAYKAKYTCSKKTTQIKVYLPIFNKKTK